MFINISNHPSDFWQMEQLKEAEKFGEIVDYPFPVVSPYLNEEQLSVLADDTVSKVLETVRHDVKNCVLHIMGEMTLTYMLVSRFRKLGFSCIASTTSRQSEVHQDGTKISHFVFVRFREYSI